MEKESLRSFYEALTQAGVEYTKKVIRVRDKFYLSGWNLAMASMGITEGHPAYQQPPPLSKPVSASWSILQLGVGSAQVLILKP